MKWYANIIFFLSCIISCTVLQTFVLTDIFLWETTRSDRATSLAELQHAGRSWERLFPALYYQTWHWMTDAKSFQLEKKKVIFHTIWYQPVSMVDDTSMNHQKSKLSALHFVLSAPIKPSAFMLSSWRRPSANSRAMSKHKSMVWGKRKADLSVTGCDFFLEGFNPWKD